MASVGRTGIIVGLNAKAFNRGMRRVKKSLGGFAKSVGRMAVRVTALGAALGAAGLAAVVGVGVKLAAEFEQANVSFTTLLGSAEKAKTVLADIEKFAASTPFAFPELVSSGKKLLAFGTTAEELVPTMRMLGDLSAGIGAPVGEIAEIFGKARVQGRLFMEDINQLSGRGINVISQLAKQFKVAEKDVRGLVSSGQVGFANIEQAFMDMTSEGGQFFGLMEAQSKTTAGLWSTLKDNLGLVARTVGDALLPSFNELMSGMITMMPVIKQFAQDSVKHIGGFVQKFIEANTTGKSLFERFVDGFGTVAITIAAVADKLNFLKGIFQIVGGAVNTVFGGVLSTFGMFTQVIGLVIKGLIKINELMGASIPQGARNMADAASTLGANLREEGTDKINSGLDSIKAGAAAMAASADGALEKGAKKMVNGFKSMMEKQNEELAMAAGDESAKRTESVLKGTAGLDLSGAGAGGKKKGKSGPGFRQIVASRVAAGMSGKEQVPVKADPNELSLLAQIVSAIKKQQALAS